MSGIMTCENRVFSPVVPLFFCKTASKLLAIIFVTAAFLFPQNEALAAVTYFASASNPADNGTLGATPVAVVPPGLMVTGDLVILVANTRTAGITPAISVAGGQAWTSQTANTTNASQIIFWARYNGIWSANPSVSFSTSVSTTVVMHVFRPTSGSNTWAIDVAQTNANFAAPAAPRDVTVTGINTVTDGALVFATWTTPDDNTWGLQTAGWSNAGTAQYRNLASTDSSQSSAYKIMPAAGASGNVVNRQLTLGGDAGNSSILAFKEVPVTTLATGADPLATTIAPGAAATDVDLFTLQTSSGTEAITSVTVNLSTSNGVGRLAITDNAGTELGFTISPATGSNTIAVAGMSATTTLTTFKVRITPLSHAAMPLPAVGAAYAITAPVTAWAGPNTHAGSDTNTNALTIDNLSPASATATSGSAGNAKTTLNWTASSSADFATTSGSVVYRWAAASAGAEVPAEGSTPTLGNSYGTATAACLVSSSASAALVRIDGTGGSADCTTTALTNGQAYTYKIFQRDTNGNYDVGVTVGPFTPLLAAPTVIKSFGAATIGANGTSTLTITITNPNTAAISGLAFTDNYPSANLKNATTPALTNSCSGTPTGTAGASTLSLSGGTLPASSSCSVSVSVTSATAGSYLNSTGAVTSTNATSGTAASATLTVTAISAANSTVVANPTLVPADNSNTSTITVTLKDGASNGVSGKTVTLAAGSGSSTITTVSGTTNASGVATFTAKDGTAEGPITYTATDATDAIVVTQTAQVTFVGPLNCTSNASGNWILPATWTNCRGGIPLANDQVTILNTHTVTLNTTTPILGNLTNGGTLNASGANTLSIGGSLTNNGTMSLGSSNVDLYGNFTNTTGTSFNPGATDSGIWTFRGTALQNIDSTGILTTFPSLALNNTFGIALNASVSIKTLMTLTNGYISTGTNIISTLANCPGSVARTNGFVTGNLRLTFPSGTTTCTYYVGSGTTYAPISLTLTASASGTTLTGSTTGNEHPQITTSGIDDTKDVNRYWSLWTTGDTATAVTSYNAAFTFVSGDLDIGATTSNFIVGEYAGGAWSQPAVGTRTATSTSVTNVSGPITATTGFAVGEVGVVDSPCTSPAGMTCVCDNFARAYLNPSTIFGADWAVGHSSGAFGDPTIVSNSLRLTDANGNVSTVATLPGQFPAAGNLITVEFRHYAYGSTNYSTASPCSASNPCGADGIALTLSDSAVTPVAGAYGGSLGYAQKTGINGFAGGWLGVGIDEWGNFANPTEGRVGGSGFIPESVTLRGSGSGSGNGSTNYPYLVSTGTIAASAIDNALSSSRSWGYLYRITVDASAYTWNGSTGVKATKVKVERDTGAGYTTLPNLNLPDIYTYNTGQADVPANWKLSFTGASGADTNIHEIRNLKICSNFYTPPAGFSILVDNLSPTTCTTASNGKPIVTVSAHDSSGNVVTNYTSTVTLSARISSPNGSNSGTAIWSKVAGSANGTLSGNQYTFVAADNGVAKFYLTDATAEDIYIAVSENGSTLSTTLSTPVQYRGTAFTVATPDTLGAAVVAGRNHLMSITRSSGCGTDTTYNGTKNLDGWYSVAATHPAGAYAPQLCATSGGSCLPSTGNCVMLSIAPPSLDASNNYLPPLTFTNGVANFCLATTDIGNYSVNLRDDSNIAVPITGSSATLAVRPFAVVVSGVKQGLNDNPAVTTTGGTPLVAGANFMATVGGYLWNSAAAVASGGSEGLPLAGATYATMTASGLAPRYADTVTFGAASPYYPATGVLGAFTNGVSISGTGVTVTATTLNYPETGSFTLTATPAANYLNSGVNLSNRVTLFAGPANASGAVVGRFRPAYFEISAPVITPRSENASCSASSFTYMGEPMGVSFTLTPRNAAGGTTTNYRDFGGGVDYSKFPTSKTTTANWIALGAPDSVGLWMNATGHAVSPGSCTVVISNATPSVTSYVCTGVANPASVSRAAGPRVTVSAPGITWSTGGIGSFTANATLERADTPDGAYATVNIGVVPMDAEGVTVQTSALNLDTNNDAANERVSLGTTQLRFGRLKLSNAYGSELLDLPVPLVTQYWDGTAFVTNAADNCTTLSSTNMSLTYPSGSTLNATNMGVSHISLGGSPVGVFLAGRGTLKLTKPSGTLTGRGSVTLTEDLVAGSMTYLQGAWTGTSYTQNPSALATFGVYKGNNAFIYLRENY